MTNRANKTTINNNYQWEKDRLVIVKIPHLPDARLVDTYAYVQFGVSKDQVALTCIGDNYMRIIKTTDLKQIPPPEFKVGSRVKILRKCDAAPEGTGTVISIIPPVSEDAVHKGKAIPCSPYSYRIWHDGLSRAEFVKEEWLVDLDAKT